MISKCMQQKKKTRALKLEMVSKPTEHLIDLIVVPLSEKSIISSKEKYIVPEVSKEDQIVEVPHIDFIIRARPLTLESEQGKHFNS